MYAISWVVLPLRATASTSVTYGYHAERQSAVCAFTVGGFWPMCRHPRIRGGGQHFVFKRQRFLAGAFTVAEPFGEHFGVVAPECSGCLREFGGVLDFGGCARFVGEGVEQLLGQFGLAEFGGGAERLVFAIFQGDHDFIRSGVIAGEGGHYALVALAVIASAH